MEKLWRQGCNENMGPYPADGMPLDQKEKISKSEFKNTCYIIVSHAMLVDKQATLLDSLYDQDILKSNFEPSKAISNNDEEDEVIQMELTQDRLKEEHSLVVNKILSDIYKYKITPKYLLDILKQVLRPQPVWEKQKPAITVYCSLTGGQLDISYDKSKHNSL